MAIIVKVRIKSISDKHDDTLSSWVGVWKGSELGMAVLLNVGVAVEHCDAYTGTDTEFVGR